MGSFADMLVEKVKESKGPRVKFGVNVHNERQPFAYYCVKFLTGEGKVSPASDAVEMAMVAAFESGLLDKIIPRKIAKTFALAAYGEAFAGCRKSTRAKKSKARKATEAITGGGSDSKLQAALDKATS